MANSSFGDYNALDPLILDLREVLWNKKAQEEGKNADTKVQDAKKVHNATLQTEGPMPAKVQDAKIYLKEAVKEIENIKVEALPEFDPEWFCTLAFGPSLEN
jgi:hypothetical protein